ncbi:MAG: hypothetical protein RRC34_00725 [Lentisphaeria bacterium]|nr:hypothetical protein [Lentisphaeria bacterium]
MLDEGEQHRIASCTWDLPCPEIAVLDQGGQAVATGHGCIANDTIGKLIVTVYVNHQHHGGRSYQNRIPHSSTLHCTDIQGRTWVATGFNQSNTCGYGDSHFDVLTFEGEEVAWEYRPIPGPEFDHYSGFTYLFPDGLRFPANHKREVRHEEDGKQVSWHAGFDTAEFSLGAMNCRIQPMAQGVRFGGHLENQDFNPVWPEAALEAIKFVLGSRCAWQIGKVTIKGTVRLTVRACPYPLDSRFGIPPIDHRPENADHIWRLAVTYFEHLSARGNVVGNPLVKNVNHLIHAGGSTPEAFSLALVTGLEGVLHYAVPSPQPDSEFEAAVDRTRQHIKSGRAAQTLEITKKQWDRIDRAIGRLATPNAQKSAERKLAAMEAEGVVTEKEIKAWQYFRNPAVHPGGGHGKTEEKHDPWSVNVLFHKLVFHAIGYTGPYSDWSQPGPPLCKPV